MASPEIAVHHLDADSYLRIVDSGALADQRLELLDGLLADISPNSPRHAAAVERLTRHLAAAAGLRLRVQLPLVVAGDSVPEPDLALVSAPASATAHPSTADLVIEVAVTSAALDRGRKAALYARAAVSQYWVVDVPNAVIEVFADPDGGAYGRVVAYRPGDTLPSPARGVADLAVAGLLGDLVP